MSESERRAMRGALGELTWLATCSRPDLAAACSLLQQRVSNACVSDLIAVNTLVAVARDFAATEVCVKSIPLDQVEFCAWSDASWANACDKKSQ